MADAREYVRRAAHSFGKVLPPEATRERAAQANVLSAFDQIRAALLSDAGDVALPPNVAEPAATSFADIAAIMRSPEELAALEGNLSAAGVPHTREALASYVAAALLRVPKKKPSAARSKPNLVAARASRAIHDEHYQGRLPEPYASDVEEGDAVARLAESVEETFSEDEGERIPYMLRERQGPMRQAYASATGVSANDPLVRSMSSLGASEGMIVASSKPPTRQHVAYEDVRCTPDMARVIEDALAKLHPDQRGPRTRPTPELAQFVHSKARDGDFDDYSRAFEGARRALAGVESLPNIQTRVDRAVREALGVPDAAQAVAILRGTPLGPHEPPHVPLGTMFVRRSVRTDGFPDASTLSLPLSEYTTRVLVWKAGLETWRLLYRPDVILVPEEARQKRRNGARDAPSLELLGPRFTQLVRLGGDGTGGAGSAVLAKRNVPELERLRYRALSAVLVSVARAIFRPPSKTSKGRGVTFGAVRMKAFYDRFIKSPLRAAHGALSSARYHRTMPIQLLPPEVRDNPTLRERLERMRSGKEKMVRIERGEPTPTNPSGVKVLFRGVRAALDETVEEKEDVENNRRKHKMLQPKHVEGAKLTAEQRAFRGDNFGMTAHRAVDGECPAAAQGPGVSTDAGSGKRRPGRPRRRKRGAGAPRHRQDMENDGAPYVPCVRDRRVGEAAAASASTPGDHDGGDDGDGGGASTPGDHDALDAAEEAKAGAAEESAESMLAAFQRASGRLCDGNMNVVREQVRVLQAPMLRVPQWAFPAPRAPRDARSFKRDPPATVIPALEPFVAQDGEDTLTSLVPGTDVGARLVRAALRKLATEKGIAVWDVERRDLVPEGVRALEAPLRRVDGEDAETTSMWSQDAWNEGRVRGHAIAVGRISEDAVEPIGIVKVRRTPLTDLVREHVRVSDVRSSISSPPAPRELWQLMRTRCSTAQLRALEQFVSATRGKRALFARKVRELEFWSVDGTMGDALLVGAIVAMRAVFVDDSTSWLSRVRDGTDAAARSNQVLFLQPITPSPSRSIFPHTWTLVSEHSPFVLATRARRRMMEENRREVVVFRPTMQSMEAAWVLGTLALSP